MSSDSCLAYVFWHWPERGEDLLSYEEALRDFQQVLVEHAPFGYRGGAAFRHEQASWLDSHGPCYADWYLTDGSAALDPLNQAAVSLPCRDAHDRAAHRAAGGAAGLYRLRLGEPRLKDVCWATWFSKPAGMTYEALYESVTAAMNAQHCGLWRRQMVLGPTSELCVLGARELELGKEFAATSVAMELFWSHD